MLVVLDFNIIKTIIEAYYRKRGLTLFKTVLKIDQFNLKPYEDRLPSGQMKSDALDLYEHGNLHQVIRKEILFGLVPKTLSGLR